MKDYKFDRQKMMDIYNGKVKNDSWSNEYTNEVDAIQETFNFMEGEDLKRASDLFNLSLKIVNENPRIKVPGTREEYEEQRNAFFADLGFEIKGKRIEEAEPEMER